MRHQPVQTRQIADEALERAMAFGAGIIPVQGGFVTLTGGLSGAVSAILTANSRIFFSLVNPNGSTLLGRPEATVTPGSPGSFIVTSHSISSPATQQAGDSATYAWEVYEAANGNPFVPPINLGLAANYAGIGKAGITNVPTSVVTGNLGVSPAAASTITGLALVLDGSGQFSTSAQVTGRIYAADYAPPTPALTHQAVLDMEAAYTAANALLPNITELGGGTIGGMNLAPGVYKWTTGVNIATNLTLTGSATDVWVFQIAGTLDLSVGQDIVLTGGALASNVFWAVAGATTIHGTATFRGTLLSATSIAVQAGATVRGRLLAQTGVTLDSDTLIQT